jgi:uncharacterized membrane protein YgcG
MSDTEKKPPEFGHRKPEPLEVPPDPAPSYLAKRSTVVTLVLVGGIMMWANSAAHRERTCVAPGATASPEAQAEYDRCRSRHKSSSGSHGSSFSSSSSGSSSSTHSTASRGGFGSTGSAHASGG